jgi:ADP-ribose pyrophosphatase YjhB (NUDIX family)
MTKERFKIIPTVYLILLKGNKILLARRYNTGFHDGEYSFPAGHLDGNETMVQTMIREAKEEIGVSLSPSDLQLVHVMHRKEPNEERVNLFFTAKNWESEPKIMEPHKCDDLNWFDLDNLPDNIIPYIKQVIACLRENKFYSEIGW